MHGNPLLLNTHITEKVEISPHFPCLPLPIEAQKLVLQGEDNLEVNSIMIAWALQNPGMWGETP